MSAPGAEVRRWRALVVAGLLAVALMLSVPRLAAALDPGAEAVVSADGDCLRLRLLPGLASTILTCIPDGSTVTILAGETLVDGVQWQRLSYSGQAGWSNAQYLRQTAGPSPASTPPIPPQGASEPTLTGSFPPAGVGLAVWSGGDVARMSFAAAQKGCGLRAVWTTPSGTFIGYVFGAPSVVNSLWLAAYPGNTLDANSPVIVVCGAGAPSGGTPSQPSNPGPAAQPTPAATPPTGTGQVAVLPPGVPATPPGPAGNR